jgi:hypothetical protein
MSVKTSLSRSTCGVILAHLRTLRMNLATARNALLHFKVDRVDRDKLEPAARRVDELMNLFAGDLRDPEQGLLFIGEIQSGVEEVTNPKAADALREARDNIEVLIKALQDAAPGGGPAPLKLWSSA